MCKPISVITVLANFNSQEAAPNTIQHRLSGGGIADNMLKDPSENERMERVKK